MLWRPAKPPRRSGADQERADRDWRDRAGGASRPGRGRRWVGACEDVVDLQPRVADIALPLAPVLVETPSQQTVNRGRRVVWKRLPFWSPFEDRRDRVRR